MHFCYSLMVGKENEQPSELIYHQKTEKSNSNRSVKSLLANQNSMTVHMRKKGFGLNKGQIPTKNKNGIALRLMKTIPYYRSKMASLRLSTIVDIVRCSTTRHNAVIIPKNKILSSFNRGNLKQVNFLRALLL